MISKLFEHIENENFIELIISDKEKNNKSDINKIVIKPLKTHSIDGFQAAEYKKN